jgi:hypothetical protein
MFPCYFIWQDPQESFEDLKSRILKDIKENGFENYVVEKQQRKKKNSKDKKQKDILP